MSIQSIVDRCSQFTGWKFQWKIEQGQFRMFDPAANSLYGGSLTLGLGGWKYQYLREIHGRTWHVGMSEQDEQVIKRALIAARLPEQGECVVTEWDGTLESARFCQVDDGVKVLYKDGVCHAVSVEYFHSVANLL